MFGELRPVDGGSPILLEKPSITVGQDRTSDVVIEHPSVSASHCHLEFREGHWFIEDLGSRDGIRVNGEKVASAWVPALSVINIGAIEFDLQYSSSEESASAGGGSVSPELLSKLDRASKSVTSFKTRRIQIRADQPPPTNLPKSPLGTLQPTNGGHSILLLYDELYLGRDPDSDVILPYLSVAKTHCVLRFQVGYWLVRDLNHNGVTINGEATQEGWLLPGATLGLATHQFVMNYSTTADGPPPEMAVPLNDFDVRDEPSAEPESDEDSDVIDLDESALIDSDDERNVADLPLAPQNHQVDANAVSPARDEFTAHDSAPSEIESCPRPAFDQPLVAIEGMWQAIEEPSPPSESFRAPVDELKRHEPTAVVPPTRETSVATSTTPIERPPSENRRQRRSVRVAKTPKTTLSPPNPSATMPTADLVRSRCDQLVRFVNERRFDGLLLTHPTNLAWLTGGADVPRDLFGRATAAVLVTPEAATLLARGPDVEVMLGPDRTLLPHRVCKWPEAASEFLKDWAAPKRLASDDWFASGHDVSSEIASLRWPLPASEIEVLRKLAIRVTRAIEKAAREFLRGDTEAQIAGDVASRLVRHEVVPERIQVWGDGRGQTCPNWKFRRDPVEHFCTIAVTARRQGLHVAVSRTVSFGTPPKELRWTHSDMLLTHATAMHMARDQADAAAVVTQVETACDKLGFVPDWTIAAPGCVTGYAPCETLVGSQSSLRLQAGMPLIWQSSLGPARAIDTFLVRKANSKWLTQSGEWPQLRMSLDGTHYFGQAVLQRPN